jgi:tetratricopeptide (TPR) repeat protein
MVERHPRRSRLEQFGSARLSRQENREILRHLLSGCVRCRRVTERFLPRPARALSAALETEATSSAWAGESEPNVASEDLSYAPAFAAARRELGRRQKAFAAERAAAPGLLLELAPYPFHEQWLLIANETRFQSWALCDLLLEASREWGFQDPGRALDLAELGAAAAALLNPAVYGPTRVNDLAARAWSTLANAERIRSDFRAAEKGFAHAEQLLKEGTGDPLEKAWLLLLKASLRGNQGRFREASRLLDRVAHIADRNGDLPLLGKALLTKGFLASVDGRPEEAIDLLTQGLERVDVSSSTGIPEPRLLVAARHNLILCLNESGRHREALALLAETRPLYLELGDRMNLVRLQWVEGKIALALGNLGLAEALFQEVRQELVSRELGYDAALLSLDLARIYAQEGRSAELRRLAEEMLPIFQSRDVQREILATLIVFQKAAEMERVTLDLVQELSAYLVRCRKTSATPDPRQRGPF